MGIIAQKAPTETTEIKRPYDAAELRSLPRDEQARQRQVYLKSWNTICSCSNKSGREAAKEIGVPVRTLYEWKKKPVPESTCPHNFRKRKDKKEKYEDIKKSQDAILDKLIKDIRNKSKKIEGFIFSKKLQTVIHTVERLSFPERCEGEKRPYSIHEPDVRCIKKG